MYVFICVRYGKSCLCAWHSVISRWGGTDPPILNLEILWGEWPTSLPSRFSLGKSSHWSPIEAGWAPGVGLVSVERISLPHVGNLIVTHRPPTHSLVTNLIAELVNQIHIIQPITLWSIWTPVSYLSLDLSRRLSLWKFPTNKLYFLTTQNRYISFSGVQRFKRQYTVRLEKPTVTQLVKKFPLYEPVSTAPVTSHTMVLQFLKSYLLHINFNIMLFVSLKEESKLKTPWRCGVCARACEGKCVPMFPLFNHWTSWRIFTKLI